MQTIEQSAHILREQVRQAYETKTPLVISGGNSKGFYGRPSEGEPLETVAYGGIIAFEPTELTISARAGTPLLEIEQILAANGLGLACEPPHFSDHATLGGMVAAGLSGPARPFRASVQDLVLGCTLLNGRGDILKFGGKVMKNVAGYDISRLLAGSLGCLGVIMDVTLKVMPVALAEASYAFTLDRDKGPALVNDLRRQGMPVSATCQIGGELLVRFSAGHREIDSLAEMLTRHYDFIPWRPYDESSFWSDLREHKLPFFDTPDNVWRLSAPVDADISILAESSSQVMTEWGGALHWLKSASKAEDIFSHMANIDGHATLFRVGSRSPGYSAGDRFEKSTSEIYFQPLSPVLLDWHKQLKNAFDPAGIMNQEKMYPGI